MFLNFNQRAERTFVRMFDNLKWLDEPLRRFLPENHPRDLDLTGLSPGLRSRGRFGIRVISGHKGIAGRKTFIEQYRRVITCRPLMASTPIAQSIVHRGVR